MTTITLYSRTSCVQCTASQRELKKVGVEFENYGDVVELEDRKFVYADATTEENLSYVKDELGYMQAPVMTVVSADGELVDHWSGFRPDKIVLHAA